MKAAFIGRFQPFHEGHRKVVEEYRNEFEEFCIVIGSSGKRREEENPLSFEERKSIIEECYPELEILGIEDRESDSEWIEELKRKSGADVVISQNDLVKKLVREDKELKLEDHELYSHDIFSGTEVRRRMRSGEEWRYLVSDCAREKISGLEDKIRESGIDYEYEPGWKKENAYHGTAD
ncbi:MAG: adenylyltransferase/cytidyltransferase family protein [Candidatus Nanohaloarchaea archaeon]